MSTNALAEEVHDAGPDAGGPKGDVFSSFDPLEMVYSRVEGYCRSEEFRASVAARIYVIEVLGVRKEDIVASYAVKRGEGYKVTVYLRAPWRVEVAITKDGVKAEVKAA